MIDDKSFSWWQKISTFTMTNDTFLGEGGGGGGKNKVIIFFVCLVAPGVMKHG